MIENSSQFRCIQCKEVFDSGANQDNIHTCNNNSKNENVLKHQHKKLYKCENCLKIYSRKASLDGHLKNEHFQCNQCCEIFNFEIKLRQHKQQKHTNQEYPLQTNINNDTNNHEINNENSKSKKHPCLYCGKIFVKNCLLERHERIHRNERPYSCPICNKAFTQKCSLTIHQLKHTGERPHPCPHCPQRFAQKTNLFIHVNRCHSKDSMPGGEFACSQCTCKFKKLSSLNAHVGRWHKVMINRPDNSNPNSVVNELNTDEDSSNEVDITNVMMQLNEIAQPSSIKEKNYTNFDEYNTNSTSHSTEIKSQSESLVRLVDRHPDGKMVQYNAKLSVNNNGVRMFACTFCDKKFSRPSDMIRHVRTHTKDKPYKCDICNRRFTVKVSLKVHMHIHNKSNKDNKCSTNYEIDKNDYNNVTAFNTSLMKPILLTDKQNVENVSKKTYECYICHNFFKLKHSLRQHINSHFGVKEFKCKHCEK